MCSFGSFHNNLRRLVNIDRPDFVAAVGEENASQWATFRDNPHMWFIRAPEAQAMKVWRLMERTHV